MALDQFLEFDVHVVEASGETLCDGIFVLDHCRLEVCDGVGHLLPLVSQAIVAGVTGVPRDTALQIVHVVASVVMDDCQLEFDEFGCVLGHV